MCCLPYLMKESGHRWSDKGTCVDSSSPSMNAP